MEKFDLRKEEYLSLRKETETHIAELGQLERNCVLAAAVVYAWLVKDGSTTSVAQIGWYIPVLFPVFGGLRSLSLVLHIFAIGRYVSTIESAHLTNDKMPPGWEHFLKKERSFVRTAITVVFWLTFLSVTIAVALKNGCVL